MELDRARRAHTHEVMRVLKKTMAPGWVFSTDRMSECAGYGADDASLGV